jgi:hypothetical protein
MSDHRLQKIAEILLLNSNLIHNLGLLNGKMGIAIFFYHYARYSKDEIYEIYAGNLVDDIYNEISDGTPLDFYDGITGVGWGIEYLIQQGFVEADRDEVLESLDQTISTGLTKRSGLPDINQIIGFGFYYLSRLQGRDIDEHNPIIQTSKNQLVSLIDQCEKLVTNRVNDFATSVSNLSTLNSVIHFVIECHNRVILPGKTQTILENLPHALDAVLSKSHTQQEIRTLSLNITKILTIGGGTLCMDRYKILLNSLDALLRKTSESEEETVNNFVISSVHALLYRPDINQNHQKDALYKKVLEIVDNETSWNQWLQLQSGATLGLNGLAGLGLALLQPKFMSALTK